MSSVPLQVRLVGAAAFAVVAAASAVVWQAQSSGVRVAASSTTVLGTASPAAPSPSVTPRATVSSTATRRPTAAVAPAPRTPAASTPPARAAGAVAQGAAPSGYTFLFPATSAGPIRWNPCRSVHYVTNLSAAPGMRADVTAALARITALTGIRFVFAGDTTEHARGNRPVVDAARYGAQWSPVLIDVASPQQSDLLRDGHDGEGVATWWQAAGAGTQIVTGQVVIRAGSVPTRRSGFADPDAAGVFLLHELGHVVGLGHVTTAGSLMNHQGELRGLDFTVAERSGLSRLGAASGCLSVMPLPAGTDLSVPLSVVH